MPLQIRTTGIEDYLDGGSANIKMLLIGDPGAGKTRMSSFWPKPIYADCEGGRGSLADRNVPYTDIRSSQDMLDFLAFLKQLESTPKDRRQYQTVIIDTIDGFQRRVKDEWLQANKAQAFRGYDAWGYLDSKMQLLTTRLMNLDYNVIVAVHYKTKGGGDDETREIVLQLQGDVKDSLFQDFDLVGWLGTYWEAEDGERVEKRGLTFRRTPERPFVKDRFGVMPRWVPISLTSESDYTFVREAFEAKRDQLRESEIVGEIPSVGPDYSLNGSGVAAADQGTGPLPPQDPRTIPLHQQDKPTLQKMARELGVDFKGNTLKSELIAGIEAKRAETPTESDATAASPEQAAQPEEKPSEQQAPAEAPATEPAEPDADSTPVETADGEKATVNEATGELTPMPAEDIAVQLGGEVVPDAPVAEETVTAPAEPEPAAPAPAEPAPPAPAAEVATCEWEGCTKDLANENQDYVKLSFIKFRKRYCGEHFVEAKRG